MARWKNAAGAWQSGSRQAKKNYQREAKKAAGQASSMGGFTQEAEAQATGNVLTGRTLSGTKPTVNVGRGAGTPRRGTKGYSVNQNLESAGWMDVAGQTLSGMGRNLMKEGGDGWGIAKMIGKTALKGAVGGAAIGGTTEWAQGGSFWTGAKSGAFNGALIGGGLRGLQAGSAAKTINPFSKQGPIAQTMGMYGGMSKSAKRLIEQKAAAATNKAQTTAKKG